MPLKGEAKREYNKLRQRRRRGFGGVLVPGDRSGKGVVPNVVPNVVPALRENVVPAWVSEAPRPFQGKAARAALGYMRYIAERGYTLDRETGELLDLRLFSQERIEALEEALLATQQALAGLQVDISMQRAEAILDDHMRGVKEKYHGDDRR